PPIIYGDEVVEVALDVVELSAHELHLAPGLAVAVHPREGQRAGDRPVERRQVDTRTVPGGPLLRQPGPGIVGPAGGGELGVDGAELRLDAGPLVRLGGE